MTKKEMAMYNEMVATVKALNDRIEKLEAMLDTKTVKARTTVVEPKAEPKKPTEQVVGNLVFSGEYVKTGTGFMSSKTRYAIAQRIAELGGEKLGKGNPVYEKCHKADKFVQVYKFKTVKDCQKFMAEQQERMGK